MARERIFRLIREGTTLNDWLSAGQRRLLVWLEEMLEYRLGPVSFSTLVRDRPLPFRFGVLRAMWFKGRDSIVYGGFDAEAKRTINMHQPFHAVDASREVFEALREKLGEQKFFFVDKKGGGERVSSLDICAYAYLKQVLENLLDEPQRELLVDSFPTLVKFVERIDEMGTAELRRNAVKWRPDVAKVIQGFNQRSDYTGDERARCLTQNFSEDAEKVRKTRRIYICLMAASFVGWLHLKSTPFKA